MEEGDELKPVKTADGRLVYVKKVLFTAPDHIVAIDADGKVVKLQL